MRSALGESIVIWEVSDQGPSDQSRRVVSEPPSHLRGAAYRCCMPWAGSW